MGSFAYGVSSDTSDMDIYGFHIPPKEIVFPHLTGYIEGFDEKPKTYDVFTQHHVNYQEKEYDFQVFSIVRYFQLAMDNNPNMVDSLYTPEYCVLHSSKVGDYVREERKMFLHKGSYHRFKGYAFSQLHKAKNKSFRLLFELCREANWPVSEDFDELTELWEKAGINREAKTKQILRLNELYGQCTQSGKPNPKRVASILKYGWDVKFGYHIIRLADEAEQILTNGTINLQNAREHMKAVREGRVSLEAAEKWFEEKSLYLEKLYHESKVIPHSPDVQLIKKHLLNCLEMYYGTLERVEKVTSNTLADIVAILRRDGVY